MICEKGVRGREVSLELTNGQATALMYHRNFFCFLARVRVREFLYFYIFLYIFRGLSKPYMMGASEILRVEMVGIKGRNGRY
ncbi:hypothetical protein EPE85_08540 [Campylobacter coli]|nr:hypothetical protein [Campylobacter coli]